jgi:hypothetical protein
VQGPARQVKKRPELCKFIAGYKMIILLKGQKFEDVAEIQTESQVVLGSITTRVYQGCLQQWERCWARCINSEGGNSTDQKAFQPKLFPLIKRIAS